MLIAVPFAVDASRGLIAEYVDAVAARNTAKYQEIAIELAQVIPEGGLQVLFFLDLETATGVAIQNLPVPYDEDYAGSEGTD